MDESEAIDPLDGSMLDVSFTEEVDNSKAFTCGMCMKKFTTKNNLTRHIRGHDYEAIKCNACTQFFKTEADREKHVQDKHSNILCEACGKTFKRMSYLNQHIKMHQSSEDGGKHKCPFKDCGKTYNSKTKFQDHFNIHTGARPYACQACTKTFTCRYQRNDHQRVCTNVTEHKCSKCKIEFMHHSSLRNHNIAEHSRKKFICTCGAVFKYQSGLTRHRTIKKHQ